MALQAPLSMGFPRQEHWSGLPLPSLGDLPNPGYRTHISCLAGGFWATFLHFKVLRTLSTFSCGLRNDGSKVFLTVFPWQFFPCWAEIETLSPPHTQHKCPSSQSCKEPVMLQQQSLIFNTAYFKTRTTPGYLSHSSSYHIQQCITIWKDGR